MLYAIKGPKSRYKLSTITMPNECYCKTKWRIVTILSGPTS